MHYAGGAAEVSAGPVTGGALPPSTGRGGARRTRATPQPRPPLTLRPRSLLTLFVLLLCGAAAACSGSPTAAPEEVVLLVAPFQRECRGMVVMQCMQVKERPQDEWRNFFDHIEGFQYEPGFSYRLRVLKTPVPNPPADGSSVEWRLLEALEKTPA